MKKRIFILTLILSLFLILTLTGCDKSSPVNFTINFDSQGGSYVPPIDFSNDKTTTFIPPANPVKEGYIFGGWYFDLNYEKEFIEQTFSIGEGSITLYAKWTILQNTITFNTMGGSSVDSITQPYDSAVSTPAAPTKDGYEFINWYVNEECTTEFVFDKMPLESLVLYAGWQDVLKIMHTEKNIAFTQYNDENIYYYDNIEDIIYFSEYNFVHNPVSAIISDYDNFCAFNFASKDYAELFVAENRDKLIHENIKAVGTCVYAYMNDAYDCLNYEIVTIDNIMYVRTKVNSYSVFGFFERNSDDSIIEEITILGEIEGIPVTSISDYAFSNNNSFNITLPDSIETIGSYAFGYSRLKNIILSATSKLKTIESNAFYNAEITEFNIPTSLESIGENAFEYSSLETLNVPLNSNLKNIGQNAFNQTDWLYNQETGLLYIGKVLYTYIGSMPDIYEITLENDTLAIAPFAFEEMSNISSIILNEGLEIIGEKALRFTGISSLSIPASVQEIGLFAFGENAIEITVDEDNKFYKAVDNVLFNKSGTKLIGFYNMTLTSYTIPDTVDEICDYAFYGSALEEIIIPQSVTYIGDYAFKYSYNLTSISIPKAVTYLGTEAFYDCGNLTSVIIEDNSLMTHIGDSAFLSCYSLNSIDFGENSVLAYLGSYAFENSALTSIVIPESITEISEGTFNYCEYLTSVTLPDSIIGIGKDAFNSCINLSNINIPSSLKTIGEKAFYKTSISSLVLPSSLTSIDNYAFAECAQLSTVSFAQDGTLKEIPARLFYKCLLLTEVVLPQSLEIIGQYAFDGCSLLSEIIFPANLKFIDVAAFQSAGLTTVNIPAGIEVISNYTFNSCEKLVAVNFAGTNIKTIGHSAFNYCELLVNINSNNTLPNGLEKIDGYAFANCTSLAKIVIPSSVNMIDHHAFMYTALSDLTLPQNDITMGENVFLECDSLISVNIPAEFTKIGDYAFFRCTYLSSVAFEDNSHLSEIG
ncbi:MAG TPA: leucine-rich repeat protein, partial [Clostridia bacterium]|nr:leucine-rich repeat protein [Clostridia bacterium]